MSEADELKANVAGIAQDTNMLLTRLTQIKVESERLGERIAQLQTHNLDMAKAGALLSVGMTEDYRALFNKFALTIQILETYANKV
jgi:hypothetical protein